MMHPGALTITTPTDRELCLTREFDAPAARVFEALTSPALLRRWYGPDGWTLDVCDVDLRVGGAWRFLVHRPDGRIYGLRGVYREILAPTRLVSTEAWDDWDGGETLVSTTLAEANGRTMLTSVVRFPSRVARDTVMAGGLIRGYTEAFESLAQLLAAPPLAAHAVPPLHRAAGAGSPPIAG